MHFLVTVAVLLSAPPSGGAAARRAEAAAALVAAERARGADVVEDPIKRAEEGWVAERNLGFFARGAKLVGDGRRALERVELERAESLLAEAERIYEPRLAMPAVAAEWAEAARWHGVALFALKRPDEATAAWKRAKALDPDTLLTEAMVPPDVARAFRAVAGDAAQLPTVTPRDAAADWQRELGVDEVVEAAIAVDGGVLTYAAALRRSDCGSEVVSATRADELVRRVHEAPCRAGVEANVLEAAAIAHPRPAPSLAAAPTRAAERGRAWRKPWLWVGVVGALGVGVVLAVALWPRDASYSAVADFHSFALGGR